MRYELIDGDTTVLNWLVKGGWKIENTFPNPYPQPYFFALMYLDTPDADTYDLEAAIKMARDQAEKQRYPDGIPF